MNTPQKDPSVEESFNNLDKITLWIQSYLSSPNAVLV